MLWRFGQQSVIVIGVVDVMADGYDVFLSYTDADESEVEDLAWRLQDESGLRPFLRRWHLIPGDLWVSAIEQAVEGSTTVAVLFGANEPDARRVQESQLGLIGEAERRVIPVLLPGTPQSSIGGFLRARTWVDLADHDGFQRLVAGIRGLAPKLVTALEPGPQLSGGFDAVAGPSALDMTAIVRPTPYRVFVSSTLCDQAPYHADLRQLLETVGMSASGLEPLAPGAEAPAPADRRRQLEQCDLMLMVVGWRYGHVPEGYDRSIGELEYEWARERDIPRLVFLVDEQRPVIVARDFDEADQRWTKQARLQALKERLLAREPVVRFSPENFGRVVTHVLHQWRREGAVAAARARAKAGVRSWPSRAASPTVTPTQAKTTTPRSPQPPRQSRPRGESLGDLSMYLDAVERDNATTLMLGPGAPMSSPLHPDRLRRKVRVAASREAEARGAQEPQLSLHRVFERAQRDGCRIVSLAGAPGSGKTSHLRRMALWLARRSARGLGLPPDTVPILISLPQLPEQIDDLDEAVALLVQRDPRADSSTVDALLGRDHLLFLVDGLDELPCPAHRDRVVRWLERGLVRHPRARLLLTQRTLEAEVDRRWSASVLCVQLPPLGDPEVRALVEDWSRALEATGRSASEHGGRLVDALLVELKAPEFRATRMFELTRNPLMLTVLCTLYHQRGDLPTRQVELYEQCLQILIRQWCGRRVLPRRFGEREARQLLQPLARYLHEERGRTHASARAIAPLIEEQLRADLGHDDVDGAEFLRAVSTDGGILVAKGGDSYGLLHSCFQEYLCARQLRSLSFGDPGVLDELAGHFGDPWWREVTLLVLALGEPALFDPFMRRVVRQASFVNHLDWVIDCYHDAAGATAKPFVDLLELPPVPGSDLDERQLAAARVLRRADSEGWSMVVPQLREHAYEPLRRLAQQDEWLDPASRASLWSGYTLVEIPAGKFVMGSHHLERNCRPRETPRHEVELARFFIGKYPVTNEEYWIYLRANPQAAEPEYWGDPRYNQPRQPVVGVSWHEAMAYCEWAGLTLPTEAQWERACRADTRTAYWPGREEQHLARAGWYAGNSAQCLHPVGEREPNPFGLHDIHGNVWEWCLDELGDYRAAAPREGDGLRHAPRSGGQRMIRGGSWLDAARKARSAYRLHRHPDDRRRNLGFRAIKLEEPEDD